MHVRTSMYLFKTKWRCQVFMYPCEIQEGCGYCEEYVKDIELLCKETIYTLIPEKYGISRSNITDIKNNTAKLRSFKEKIIEIRVK